MALPGVKVILADGSLGLIAGDAAGIQVKIGVATKATPGVLLSASDVTTLKALAGAGPLVEAVANQLAVAGAPALFMAAEPVTPGGKSAVTKNGTGAGTVAVTFAPHELLTITCVLGGTLGTAQFTFQVGTGPVSQPVTSQAGWSSTGYRVPGTFVVVVFTAGTYVAGGTPDIYTISTLGAVAHPQGGGPAVPTFTASPLDDYSVLVSITKAGALGTAEFTFSRDGTSANASAPIVSAGGGVHAIPGTGIVLTLASTFDLGTTYSFIVAAPSYGNTEMSACFTALKTTYLDTDYSLVTVHRTFSGSAAAATAAATAATFATELFNLGKDVRVIIECPTVGSITASAGSTVVNSADNDATVIASFAAFENQRVVVCAGDCDLASMDGLALRRNGAWPVTSRLSAVEASQDAGWVEAGALVGVTKLYRDEFKTEALNAKHFTTLRSFPGRAGFYATTCWTMASLTSDYAPMTNARVIDKAAFFARQASAPLVNGKVRRDPRTGLIAEIAAQKIEGRINGAVEAAVVNTEPQDAVFVKTEVNRTHNILADGKLLYTLKVVPFGYGREIEATLGFAVTA